MSSSSTLCSPITLIIIGVSLILLNLLFSLYNVPSSFTLPTRFKKHIPSNARSKERNKALDELDDEAFTEECERRGLCSPGASSSSSSSSSSKQRAMLSSSSSSSSSSTTGSTVNDYLSHERCYAQPDEAETCFYSGPICYDGEKVIVTSKLIAEERTAKGNDLRNSMCYDFRHFVPSQSCGYNGPHRRDDLRPNQPLHIIQDMVPKVMSISPESHRWGPLGREVQFRELDVDILRNPSDYNITLHWLDGPMYVAGMHYSWLDHTWHFAAAMMALYDIKRHNNTLNPPDNYLGTSGSWNAPPMKNLLIAGNYRNVENFSELRPWILNLLKMLIQNNTRMIWNSVWEGLGVNPQYKWVCANSGAVIGLKPRMFNSVGDAHAFRLMSYNFAGIKDVKAKDEWPPRQITLITRVGSRSIVNLDDIVPILSGTGLKFEWVQEMGVLTWEEQVHMMAKTGILLAVHGAGLANIMFMPAHSVVIEIFPYVMYASMYRDVAATAGLYYYRIQSLRPPNDTASGQLVNDDVFISTCDGEEKHISSPAAFLDYECNWRSKSSPVLLDLHQLQYTLGLALDDIGCRDSYCEFMPGKEPWKQVNMRKLAREKETT